MSTSVTGFLKSVTARDGFELRIHARGKRFVLWVGKLSLRSQREYERHVASIVDSFRSGGSIDPLDMKWASSLPERIRDKLVAWQMIPAVSVRSVSPDQRTVGGWTQLYIDEMVSENPRTKDNYGQARNWLVKSIESKKDIAAVTLGDLSDGRGQ